MSLKQHGHFVLKTFLSIKCPASLRWALSWENTDDICHIYILYIYIYMYIYLYRKREDINLRAAYYCRKCHMYVNQLSLSNFMISQNIRCINSCGGELQRIVSLCRYPKRNKSWGSFCGHAYRVVSDPWPARSFITYTCCMSWDESEVRCTARETSTYMGGPPKQNARVCSSQCGQ